MTKYEAKIRVNDREAREVFRPDPTMDPERWAKYHAANKAREAGMTDVLPSDVEVLELEEVGLDAD